MMLFYSRNGTLALLFALALPLHGVAQPAPSPLAKRIEALVTPYLAAHDFSGAILIAREGEVLFKKAYGMADYAASVPQTTDTRFLVGSVTKQFTAAAILLLETQGKLSVDDPLARFLPDFPHAEHITLHHLLTHTAGLTRDPFADWQKRREARTLAEVVEVIALHPLDAEPGAQMRYSNCGYVLLAAVIEQVSEQSYGAFLKAHIFEPLGMASSHILSAREIVPTMARGYDPGDGLFGLMETPGTDPINTLGADGLVTTIEDLYRWDQALYSDQLLPEATRENMFTNHASGRGYGFGIYERLGRHVIGHDGITHGFTAFINRYVEDRVTILYAGNIRTGTVGILENALAALVFDEPYTPYFPPVAGKPSALSGPEVTTLTGRYELFPGFYLTISEQHGHLWLAGTGGYATVLTPLADHLYFYRAMYARIRFEAQGDETRRLLWIDRNDTAYPAVKVAEVL